MTIRATIKGGVINSGMSFWSQRVGCHTGKTQNQTELSRKVSMQSVRPGSWLVSSNPWSSPPTHVARQSPHPPAWRYITYTYSNFGWCSQWVSVITPPMETLCISNPDSQPMDVFGSVKYSISSMFLEKSLPGLPESTPGGEGLLVLHVSWGLTPPPSQDPSGLATVHKPFFLNSRPSPPFRTSSWWSMASNNFPRKGAVEVNTFWHFMSENVFIALIPIIACLNEYSIPGYRSFCTELWVVLVSGVAVEKSV